VLWVVVFLVIALAGLAMLVGYAVWLAHKTADLLSELGVLADQAGQLGRLLGEIRVAQPDGSGGARYQREARTFDVG
jgi:hypothetical protein